MNKLKWIKLVNEWWLDNHIFLTPTNEQFIKLCLKVEKRVRQETLKEVIKRSKEYDYNTGLAISEIIKEVEEK